MLARKNFKNIGQLQEILFDTGLPCGGRTPIHLSSKVNSPIVFSGDFSGIISCGLMDNNRGFFGCLWKIPIICETSRN